MAIPNIPQPPTPEYDSTEVQFIGGITNDEQSQKLLIHVLIDQMYKNLVESLLREIVSNAVDQTIYSNSQQPVQVTLPTDENPQLIVEDFGLGMSLDFINTRFLWVGESTKRQDKNQIGQYGLGAKTLFGYLLKYKLDQALLESTYSENGQNYYTSLALSINAENKFCALLLQNPTPTDKPTGCKFTIPVATDDPERNHVDDLMDTFLSIKSKYIVPTNCLEEIKKRSKSPYLEERVLLRLEEEENFSVTYAKFQHNIQAGSRLAQVTLMVAGMPYKIELRDVYKTRHKSETELRRDDFWNEHIGSNDTYYEDIAKFYIEITASPAEVMLSPDRCRILEDSYPFIREKLADIRSRIEGAIQAELDAITSYKEAALYLEKHYAEKPVAIKWRNQYYAVPRITYERAGSQKVEVPLLYTEYNKGAEYHDFKNNNVNTVKPPIGTQLLDNTISLGDILLSVHLGEDNVLPKQFDVLKKIPTYFKQVPSTLFVDAEIMCSVPVVVTAEETRLTKSIQKSLKLDPNQTFFVIKNLNPNLPDGIKTLTYEKREVTKVTSTEKRLRRSRKSVTWDNASNLGLSAEEWAQLLKSDYVVYTHRDNTGPLATIELLRKKGEKTYYVTDNFAKLIVELTTEEEENLPTFIKCCDRLNQLIKCDLDTYPELALVMVCARQYTLDIAYRFKQRSSNPELVEVAYQYKKHIDTVKACARPHHNSSKMLTNSLYDTLKVSNYGYSSKWHVFNDANTIIRPEALLDYLPEELKSCILKEFEYRKEHNKIIQKYESDNSEWARIDRAGALDKLEAEVEKDILSGSLLDFDSRKVAHSITDFVLYKILGFNNQDSVTLANFDITEIPSKLISIWSSL